MDLQATFGAIDVYLFDQILRGRIPPGAHVIEAGCGGGRNIHYLLQAGYNVSAVADDALAIEAVRRLARSSPAHPSADLRVRVASPLYMGFWPDPMTRSSPRWRRVHPVNGPERQRFRD